MNQEATATHDMAVVGGGIAGTLLAWTLSEAGLSVALIDEREAAPPFFRAERISSLAISSLRELGLGGIVDRVSLPLPDTAVIKGNCVEKLTTDVDYSVRLWQLVDAIRHRLRGEGRVEMITGTAAIESTSPRIQQVRVDHPGGTRNVSARLLVVATGASGGFLKSLGIEREIISHNHSSTFGFDIEPGPNFVLPAASATVRLCRDGADYMNLFPTAEGGYRANLFTFWPAGDDRQREFLKGDSDAILRRLAPGLHEATGSFSIRKPIECGCVSVLKSTGFRQPGLVLVGDAYGRICPVAGRGINKAIHDVVALTKLAPRWIADDADIVPELLDSYYLDDERHAYEEWVFEESLSLRDRIVSKKPKQILRRILYHHAPPSLREFLWKSLGGGKRAASLSRPAVRHSAR